MNKKLLLLRLAFVWLFVASLFSICIAQRRLSFRPQQHGFHFSNRFSTLVDFAGIKTDGLCGGMVLAAFNFFRYSIAIPNLRDEDVDFNVTYHVSPAVTSGTTPLVDYIFHSQMAMNFTNISAAYFLNGLHKNYDDEFGNIRNRIDRGEYAILGLKLRPGVEGMGHQVLCYGYNSDPKELFVYDPNFPDFEITITRVGENIALKKGANIVDSQFKSFFEQQELFANRTSDRTTYDAVDNVIRNLNYAVRPPLMNDKPIMAGYGYTPTNFDYERAIPPQSIYKLQNLNTGKMMEVEDAAFAKGTKVQQYFGYEHNGLCDGKNQQWLLIPAGIVGTERVFYIINNGFLNYLEAGSDATVQPGNDNNNQKWFIQPTGSDGVYYIKSVAEQTYLEIPNGSVNDGDRFKLARFTGAANQKFRFTQYAGLTGPNNSSLGNFVSICSQLNSNKTLNVANASTDNGAAVQLYDLQNGAQNEHWQLIRTADGYYKFQSRLRNGKMIDVSGVTGGNNSNLLLWDNADVEKQKWLIVPVVREQGSYIFFNKVSGRCMDIAGATTNNGTPIQTYLFANQPNQKWRLTPVR